MNINTLTVNASEFPDVLQHIPQPPKELYRLGASLTDVMKRPRVAIVGSRTMSPYGKYVTTELAARLAERGIIIISGLAFGVDATAHRAALDVGGQCLAVLPGPLDNIVPVSNRRLATAILDNGGTLISEYASGTQPHKGNFIERNRLMSGLADAVLITEAAVKSGSLHTANFALDQGIAVLAVPGNINNQLSQGTNNLIKIGAMLVTSYSDVLHVLGLKDTQTELPLAVGRNKQEQIILDLLGAGESDGQKLLETSSLDMRMFSRTLSMLEISGKIRALGGNQWTR